MKNACILVSLLLGACGGITPAADLGVHDASVDATYAVDASSPDLASPDLASPDLATADLASPDLATSDLASLHVDLGAAKACEACLTTSCQAQVATCDADPSCVAAFQCAATSGCFGSSSTSSSVTTCLTTCAQSEGLTPKEEVMVLSELAAISTCTTSCVSACHADGGTSG